MAADRFSSPPIHVYGPVPSRRLGYSLGVDILPFKTCSLDCIYCQLGSSPRKTVRRKRWFSAAEILPQVRAAVESGRRIDIITFSGSGEPTLNSLIGPLIRGIKDFTDIPVAVLTNGTLLGRKSVREALKAADLVIPSLDAATQELFERVNRPHPSLRISDIIEGLKTFRRSFPGRIWLEIMLIKGINDTPAHLKLLRDLIEDIDPEKVQLNTVVRPPAESYARSLPKAEMERIRAYFGDRAETIASFDRENQGIPDPNLEDDIEAMIRRRPVTLDDLSRALGRHGNELIKYLNDLIQKGIIRSVAFEGRTYYEPCGPASSSRRGK